MQVSTIPSTRTFDLSIGLIISNSNNGTHGWEGVNGDANQHPETNEIGK